MTKEEREKHMTRTLDLISTMGVIRSIDAATAVLNGSFLRSTCINCSHGVMAQSPCKALVKLLKRHVVVCFEYLCFDSIQCLRSKQHTSYTQTKKVAARHVQSECMPRRCHQQLSLAIFVASFYIKHWIKTYFVSFRLSAMKY